MAPQDQELDNMSDGDLSNLEKAPEKVELYLNHDFMAAKETFAAYNDALVTQTVLMMEKLFTTIELKEKVLPSLKKNQTLQESDFMWRISMLTRKKVVKKSEILQLITQILKYINFQQS